MALGAWRLALPALLALCLLAPKPAPASGTWTQLANQAPSSVELMLLMPDGTVMAANQPGAIGNAWYRLTPDIHGSYINGTWTNLASMHDTRLYYSSDVLRDGRVFVAGAEYGTGTNSAEIYDPASNTWTMLPPPPAGQKLFYDCISKTIANGNILIAPVAPATSGGTVILDIVSNSWIVGPKVVRGTYQDEASWVKLPDDSIITIDPFGVNSERYIPSLNKWITDTTVPVPLYNNLGELGAGFLLPDGRAFFLGGTHHTAFYTPTGNTNVGSWAAGPDIPNGFGVTDGAGAMMMNGKILCAVGSSSNYNAPTYFYEFDPVANSFTSVNGPTGPTDNIPPYESAMLDLPDGTVLYSHFARRLYVYKPDGSPLAAGKPTITSIAQNPDLSYHLIGTQLNGISEGAAYGDDLQMDSNYPLVRLTDAATNVYYARTFKWSSSGVMTGNKPVSTEFVLPTNLPPASYSLVVVANGISSDPVTFSFGSLISAQPQSLTVFEGDSAAFSVTASVGSGVFYQWRFNGSALGGATRSSLNLTNVAFSQGGNYSVIVSNAATSTLSSNALLTVIPTVPLPVALNATNLGWSTDGNAVWHGLTNLSHDGFAAGKSGALLDNQLSRVQTTVTGPGQLTFWWKVSSQTNADFLSFSLDGAPQAAVSGNVDWTQLTFFLTPGSHALQWAYSKDAAGSAGQDAAWLDQVTFVFGGIVPTITAQPSPQVVLAGTPAAFSAAASGTPPLRYQWRFNGADIPAATNTSLSLAQAFLVNAGLYTMAVSNDYGSALSSNALLSVVPIAAWGDNDFSQATVLETVGNVAAIAAGGYHSLALRTDGSLAAWGNNFSGQCNIPTAATNLTAIAGGGYHSLALRADGVILGWGDDSSGQTDVPPTATNVIALAAGQWHSLALRANGTVVAWGDDSSGQTDVPAHLTNVTAVAAGDQHSLALKANGSVVAWGNNRGPTGDYAGQADVPPGLSNVVALAAGAFHSLALKSDGSLVGWGDNSSDQLSVAPGLSNALAIAAGGTHSIALQTNGEVFTWGDNLYSESVSGLILPGASAVAAGAYHNLVLISSPAGPLLLSNPIRNGHTFTVSFPTVSGKTYTLQYKNSIQDAAWTSLSSITGNGGIRTLTDPLATPTTRFYRVTQSP